MTPDEVTTEVARIISRGDDDPETSHFDEDGLAWRILDAIAKGAEDPTALASAALPLRRADLIRWYA